MQAILLSVIVIIGVGVGSMLVLESFQRTTAEDTAAPTVRLTEDVLPGEDGELDL